MAPDEAALDATVAPILGSTLGELAPLEARIVDSRRSCDTSPNRRRAACAWVADLDRRELGIGITAYRPRREIRGH